MNQSSKPQRKHISLALQGGGAHGAFTWGVLDRLMRDKHIFIDGISGTSAGAMNAAVFTDGFIKGGRQGAVDNLYTFWKKVSEQSVLTAHNGNGWGTGSWFAPQSADPWNVDNAPAFMMADFVTRMFSPYQLNPMNINPLRDILMDMVDFEQLRRRKDIKLFVSATNVRTCKLKLFRTNELCVEALLASACIPLAFQAVEFRGEHYWDGGYLANPAISPLIHECHSGDVIIVQINPMNRPDLPKTAREILNRLNEISFNSTLVREMSGMATISKLVADGKLKDTPYRKVNFHMIAAEDEMSRLGASSKFNADWRFLHELYELGVETTETWLEENFDYINVKSTLNMVETYT